MKDQKLLLPVWSCDQHTPRHTDKRHIDLTTPHLTVTRASQARVADLNFNAEKRLQKNYPSFSVGLECHLSGLECDIFHPETMSLVRITQKTRLIKLFSGRLYPITLHNVSNLWSRSLVKIVTEANPKI
ncbi:hypothetical protein RRG08_052283 [Elysia crispata]|uniref:Uncharacterized protein n=1 Tax=Elysia crispata TaxID=231223 RepID=A0AAE1A096_9GAST|nr:hypothetical protein RRG08_052283 [Elysia crispata]